MKNIKNWELFNENIKSHNVFDNPNLFDLLPKLQKTIICAETYKNVYFWHPESNADGRRRKEKKFAETYQDYEFEYGGNKFEVKYSYSETTGHIYFSLNIYKNGKKSNITSIKNILKKIEKPILTVKKYNL